MGKCFVGVKDNLADARVIDELPRREETGSGVYANAMVGGGDPRGALPGSEVG